MLKQTPWMQRPAHGKALDSGQNPKNKGWLLRIAAGVVSETRDYTERPLSRPYFSFAGGDLVSTLHILAPLRICGYRFCSTFYR